MRVISVSSLNFAMDTIDDAIQCWKHPWGTNHTGEGRTQAHRAQGLPRAHSRPGVFSWSEVEASGHDKAVGRTHAWIEKNIVEAERRTRPPALRCVSETIGATCRSWLAKLLGRPGYRVFVMHTDSA